MSALVSITPAPAFTVLPKETIILIDSFRDKREASLAIVCKAWRAHISVLDEPKNRPRAISEQKISIKPAPFFIDAIFQPLPHELVPVKEDRYMSPEQGARYVNMSIRAEVCPADDYSAYILKKSPSHKFLSTDDLGGCVAVITYDKNRISLSHLSSGFNWDTYETWLSKNELLGKKTRVALVGGLSNFQGSAEMVQKLEKLFAQHKMRIVVKDLYGDYNHGSRSLSVSIDGELTVQRWVWSGYYSSTMTLQPRWLLNQKIV